MSANYADCPTAIPEKVSLFANVSRDWWSGDVYTKHLYKLNQMIAPLITKALFETKLVKEERINSSTPLAGLSVLDVGCGGGYLSEPLAELGCQVLGIDICPDMIEVAKQHAALNPSLTNLAYLYESIEEHSKRNREKYDVVIASEVLIHVKDQDLFLKEIISCLKPGGFLFISTCNKTWGCWVFAVVLGEYMLRFFPRGLHSWNKHITPQDLEQKLQNLKCTTKGVHGMFYNPYSTEWHWSEYKFFVYSLYAIKDTL